MENYKTIINNRKVQAVFLLTAGVLLGWVLFRSPGTAEHNHSHTTETTEAVPQIWTCSMHPQIRKEEQGLCPLCGMDLIPLISGKAGGSSAIPDGAMPMSAEAVALAKIQTEVVQRKNPTKSIQLYGVIVPSERSLQSQTAHIGGRIEKLYIDFTGETVQAGQPLASIYSPELLSAQKELLEAIKLQNTHPELMLAARRKLQLWKVSDRQIAQIEQSGEPTATVEITATTSGIVMGKRVSEGDYVSQGGVLFDVADLSKVWAMFEAYETDLAFLRKDDALTFTLQALPGEQFKGNITFIDPILDKNTRTAKVRVEVANPNLNFKPEMYATATVHAKMNQYNNQIVVPQSAVLWTGKRSIVYVSLAGFDTPVYQLREVELGPYLGNSYVVLNGLKEGETIVTQGTFAIDASAQLEGKRSMMNNDQEHSSPSAEPHNGVTNHAMLRVEGNCGMCKDNIENAAKGVAGVTSANWEAATHELHLNFDTSISTINAISKAIAKAGYDTEKDKADLEVYNALPVCCKYRETD